MDLNDFLRKNKKIISVLVLITLGFLIFFIGNKIVGFVFVFFGFIYNKIVGKKNINHKKRIEDLDYQIFEIKKKSKKIELELEKLKVEEFDIENNIEKTKNKLDKMSILEKIREHNKKLKEKEIK